jgi:hypothetical protein
MLDAERWLALGAAAERDAVRRRAALSSLDALVATADVRLPAWRVRSDIETAAGYAFPATSPHFCRRTSKTAVRHAISVAESAALALLVKPLLGESDFEVLYSPFAGLDLA